MHHIQKHILRKLTVAKQARFSEMRPLDVDTNVYSYHLAAVQRDGLVQKYEKSYTLTSKGLAHVERISMNLFELRIQPKIITLMLVQNNKNQILLWPKRKQPFIGKWSLLSGKVHLEDVSVLDSVRRECIEKFSAEPQSVEHRGDCYIRVYGDSQLVSSVLAHICIVQIGSDSIIHENIRWHSLEEIPGLDSAPATGAIILQALTAHSFYFAEYNVSIDV